MLLFVSIVKMIYKLPDARMMMMMKMMREETMREIFVFR